MKKMGTPPAADWAAGGIQTILAKSSERLGGEAGLDKRGEAWKWV
jgi:hypothetical protein